MYTYKNISRTTKTFYDVAFRPNETHEVPGYINDPEFVRVPSVVTSNVCVSETVPAKKSSSATSKVEKAAATKTTTSNNSAKKEDKSNG